MNRIKITIEAEAKEIVEVVNTINWRDLFDYGDEGKAKPKTELGLFDSVPDIDERKVIHTITGFKKNGPNWRILFNEHPGHWTLPCTASGSGNKIEFKALQDFFEPEIYTETTTEIKLDPVVRCHVTMQKHERGKFKGEWIWTGIRRV